jgi:serine/threonine protein kinase
MMHQESGFLQCYGISRNPETNEFITVLDYAKKSDLRNYLQENHRTLTWKNRLNIVTKIAKDLKVIHSTGLIHGDFHSGNVLQVGDYKNSKAFDFRGSRVSDFGLSRVDCDHIPEEGVFGVVPYMAPEILSKKPYRQSADVYSYGTIMWEVSSGRPAFCDVPHDFDLVSRICFEDLRPQVVNGTPPCYVELMQRCWNKDPKKRPTSEEIYKTCLNWSNQLEEQKAESDIVQQFLNAGSLLNTAKVAEVAPTRHPEAIYTSRFYNYETKQFDLSIEHHLPDE